MCGVVRQRHFIERAQLARRVQETSTLVKETENMMEKLKMAAAAERDTEVRPLLRCSVGHDRAVPAYRGVVPWCWRP